MTLFNSPLPFFKIFIAAVGAVVAIATIVVATRHILWLM
jgi:hypothetical protein